MARIQKFLAHFTSRLDLSRPGRNSESADGNSCSKASFVPAKCCRVTNYDIKFQNDKKQRQQKKRKSKQLQPDTRPFCKLTTFRFFDSLVSFLCWSLSFDPSCYSFSSLELTRAGPSSEILASKFIISHLSSLLNSN